MYLARNNYPARTPSFVNAFNAMANERFQRERAAFAQIKANHPQSAEQARIEQQLIDGNIDPETLLDADLPSPQQTWQQAYDVLLPTMPSALQRYGYQTARDAADWWTFETHFLNEVEQQPVFDLKDVGEVLQYRERKETAAYRMLVEGDEHYVRVFSYLSRLANKEPVLFNGLADPFALETQAWQMYGCTAVDLALAAYGTGTNRDTELVVAADNTASDVSRIAARRTRPDARSTEYRFALTKADNQQRTHHILVNQNGIQTPGDQFDITTAQLVGEAFEINPAETWKRTQGSLNLLLPTYADELSRRPQAT